MRACMHARIRRPLVSVLDLPVSETLKLNLNSVLAGPSILLTRTAQYCDVEAYQSENEVYGRACHMRPCPGTEVEKGMHSSNSIQCVAGLILRRKCAILAGLSFCLCQNLEYTRAVSFPSIESSSFLILPGTKNSTLSLT